MTWLVTALTLLSAAVVNSPQERPRIPKDSVELVVIGCLTGRVLKASDVTLYAIGYLEQYTSSARNEQRMLLQRMAALTGGQAFFPTSLKELDTVYGNIQREIAARYSMGYVSSDVRTDGAWRKVEIRLKRPDLKGAKVRTRGGYFAPYRAGSNH